MRVPPTEPLVVAVVGNPNVGKTTLFNELTGLRHTVGNFAGVTVEVARGSVAERHGAERPMTLVDLPGIYSLTASAPDERIAWRVLTGEVEDPPDAVLLVLDATNLARNLYFALQVRELDIPCVVALNMVDLAETSGRDVDLERLSSELGATVVPTVARNGDGIREVVAAIDRLERTDAHDPLYVPVDEPLVTRLEASLGPARARWTITRGATRSDLDGVPADVDPATLRQAAIATIETRYAAVDRMLAAVRRPEPESAERRSVMSFSQRADRVLTHRLLGPLVFVAVMTILFQAMFAGAEPFMSGIESAMGWVAAQVRAALPPGLLVDFITQGLLAGVGNVIVFVPQIAVLFAFVGLLEDSGYLARAAFIVDRVMAKAGLSGSSFVPLLSGYACAIPAIMGTRTIRSRRSRMVTMLMIPFVSCSARLPIYALLIGAFFPADRLVLGPLSLGGLMLLAMYSLSTLSAIGVGLVYKKTILRGPRLPLFIELPPYRMPRLRHTLNKVTDRVGAFLKDAGTTILAATVVLWAVLSFPRPDPGVDDGATPIEHSVGGRVGKALEPALTPMGQDWRVGVGIIGSFAAREVFISTLGLVFGIEDADENDASLRERLRDARDPDSGDPLYTPLSVLALMVFFVYAAQCMSTLAVLRRETKSWRWPVFAFASMTAIAYGAAVLVFQVGRLLGLS